MNGINPALANVLAAALVVCVCALTVCIGFLIQYLRKSED